CRNLLIYLDSSLQRKVIPALHYALNPDGFLFLGASESAGGFTDLFEPLEKLHQIYSRKSSPTRAFHLPLRESFPLFEENSGTKSLQKQERAAASSSRNVQDTFRGDLTAESEAERLVAKRFAPPGVIVNSDLQILHFRGETGEFLKPPSGKATLDLLKMAREGLMMPLRNAI